jgi:hypothetical protein
LCSVVPLRFNIAQRPADHEVLGLRDHGDDMATADEVDRLRAERDEWRRRAEVAEAVAAERLARAETAEHALRAAEAARAGHPSSLPAGPALQAEPAPAEPRRPASLLERWRRYTDTLN